MEHITVIGAGPLGRAATRSLVEAGHRVTVATRSGTRLPGAQAVRADVVTGDGLETLAPGSAIVACVYIPANGARSKESSSMVHKASIRPQAMPTPEI